MSGRRRTGGASRGGSDGNGALVRRSAADGVGNGDGNGGAKGPQMVQQLKASFNELVIREKPNVKWDDVIGLDDAKRAIRESIVFPFERPDLFPLGWPRGMLLYGPPGCGKTILAAATAAEINGYFISIDAASIMSKWLGEAEKNVAKLFNEARKLLEKGDPVIIFIDELDSLLGSRTNEVGGRDQGAEPVPEGDGRHPGQGEAHPPLHHRGHQQAVGARLAVPPPLREAHLRARSPTSRGGSRCSRTTRLRSTSTRP